MAAFSRSHHNNKIPKLLTVYFKSCGLATKAFDTLSALGITMSQKWSYAAIKDLSERVRRSLHENIQKYPWYGTHDNINLPFRVYEQRLDNQSHFDSGTAATILVLKDPAVIRPDAQAFRQHIAATNTRITFKDILKLDQKAGPNISARLTSHVLSFLTGAPAFDFKNYSKNDHAVFQHPFSSDVLPVGPQHTACQFMLNTVHIEEASYEGNDRVLHEWWKQLKIDSPELQKKLGYDDLLIWVGDQLTVSRLRCLQKFRSQDLNSFERMSFLLPICGWFHALLAFESSLHRQYYGTRAGFGLIHDFDLLKRKGLHAPSVQGNFHYNFQDALYHITEARIRDLWCIHGKVETLEDLRRHSPEEFHAIAKTIVKEVGSNLVFAKKNTASRDDLRLQSLQFIRDALLYIDFDYAIQHGDVGSLQDHLPRLLFRFAGGQNKNYVIEMLEILQGLQHEWPDDVRYATDAAACIQPDGCCQDIHHKVLLAREYLWQT